MNEHGLLNCNRGKSLLSTSDSAKTPGVDNTPKSHHLPCSWDRRDGRLYRILGILSDSKLVCS
jgi:hypothetical protein